MSLRRIPTERLADLGSDEVGLTDEMVSARQVRFGFNDVVVEAPSTWRTLFRDTARDPMLWFLLGLSLLFAALGDYTESAVLAAALVPMVGMDAFLHRRTQASTRSLSRRLAAQASVFRNGVSHMIAAREVVPGDLVDVAAGAAFPADGLVVAGEGLQVDESSLTGEAWPVTKLPVAGPLQVLTSAEAVHWGFAGTRLLTGRARMRVVSTGGETLYGEIVRSARIGSHVRTPLQDAIARLVGLLLAASLVLCGTLAMIRLLQGQGLLDAFLSAATLAIAALPEEFPVVFTFFLGVGVYRIARRKALVRRAVAVENMGRVTCICSDKTGTLTEGKLTLAHSCPAAGVSTDDLAALASAAARSDSADPLDAALIAAAPPGEPLQRLATFPFTEVRRRETAIVLGPDGRCLAVVKGAPEVVFPLCTGPADEFDRLREQVDAYAQGGHKVIAIATRALGAQPPLDVEPDEGFSPSGLLAMEDPIREGVRDAVLECRAAGIRVIMVTGDHPATARAIAREAGLGGEGLKVVLADDLDGQADDLYRAAVLEIDVMARAAPAQKFRLVQTLQRLGEVVAVTGDGVNDVPALQIADIGIAMGERGTESAREVAAVVLLDDNFRTIVEAISEGRQLFRNLQLSFIYLLMVHIPLVLSAAAIPLAGYPLVYLPIHIVWLELIIHPTAMLVFQETPRSGQLLPTLRSGRARFFGPRSWILITCTGAMLAAVLYFGFDYALGNENPVGHARSVTLGALIAMSATVAAVLSRLGGWTARIVVGGTLASLVVLVQAPFVAGLLGLDPLHWIDWGLVAAAGGLAGLFAMSVVSSLREPANAARFHDPRTAARPAVQ
ncbi:MAG: cation-transporting P-type ATPase [Brevundimonas sp.]|jgi:Ca2+-transporting ATPase|uniref:cation-translocating P-type ATPase n=1 Tax=Brevundimonas sp. TaxID=1871086 RepID=UPI0025B9B505|nr:cation-transporting P-type ATPase [Brevundimonas sp.]MCH4267296.1 cation-transporting P-type ATPase [Brevundimonas sp.]